MTSNALATDHSTSTYWKKSVRHRASWHAVSWRHLAQRARHWTGILTCGHRTRTHTHREIKEKQISQPIPFSSLFRSVPLLQIKKTETNKAAPYRPNKSKIDTLRWLANEKKKRGKEKNSKRKTRLVLIIPLFLYLCRKRLPSPGDATLVTPRFAPNGCQGNQN